MQHRRPRDVPGVVLEHRQIGDLREPRHRARAARASGETTLSFTWLARQTPASCPISSGSMRSDATITRSSARRAPRSSAGSAALRAGRDATPRSEHRGACRETARPCAAPRPRARRSPITAVSSGGVIRRQSHRADARRMPAADRRHGKASDRPRPADGRAGWGEGEQQPEDRRPGRRPRGDRRQLVERQMAGSRPGRGRKGRRAWRARPRSGAATAPRSASWSTSRSMRSRQPPR